jgi:hypothetical protein
MNFIKQQRTRGQGWRPPTDFDQSEVARMHSMQKAILGALKDRKPTSFSAQHDLLRCLIESNILGQEE